MTAAAHAAIGDCEAVTSGLLAAWQPANTLSSLAFVAGGLWLLAAAAAHRAGDEDRRLARALAAALVAVGVGSVAYHGAGTAVARWAHDLSIVAVLLVVLAGAFDARWAGRWQVVTPTLVVAGGALAVRPEAAAPVSVVLAVAVVATALLRPGERPLLRAPWLSVAVLLVGAAVNALSRTGGPWCRPETWLQGHAAWHVAAAVAAAVWGAAVLRRSAREPDVSDRRRG
ncbi:MAG TPA: ceramidase domain-containing protein [Egibacteraceae bacterium]